MMKLYTLAVCCALFSLSLAAQMSRGSIVVTGSFQPAVSLTSTSNSQSLGSGAIRMDLRPSADGSQTVTLLTRGNTAYALTASVSSVTGGDPNAQVVVTPLSSAPTGGRTMANISANLAPANLAIGSASTAIVNGSRVSRGGNDLSADNALAIQVRVDFPAGVTAASITFRAIAQ